MLVDGVNEKETKEIIENKKEAERQSTAIFNADKERDKKKMQGKNIEQNTAIAE